MCQRRRFQLLEWRPARPVHHIWACFPTLSSCVAHRLWACVSYCWTAAFRSPCGRRRVGVALSRLTGRTPGDEAGRTRHVSWGCAVLDAVIVRLHTALNAFRSALHLWRKVTESLQRVPRLLQALPDQQRWRRRIHLIIQEMPPAQLVGQIRVHCATNRWQCHCVCS